MRAVCLLLVAGCKFSSPIVGDGNTPPPEGGGHEMMTSDAQGCFGPASGNFTICIGPGNANPFPTSTYNAPPEMTFDTDQDCTFTQMQDSGLPAYCVKTATSIMITGKLNTKGSKSLVLLATGDITIGTNGIIDAASHRGAGDGPGTVNCIGGQKDGGSDGNGGGGGAGSSYGTKGGDGGSGGGGQGSNGSAEDATVPPPPGLNGACDAGSGGSGDTGTGGTNGNGGGAVYLVAGGTISIAGLINVSGAGARGGLQANNGKGGGGGGGAGGMLVLFGHDVTFASSAVLMANGGGGGGGATQSADGGAGSDPDTNMPTMPARGGAKGGGPAGAGGLGGDGAAGTTDAGAGESETDGGGGGGGGQGFIRILSGQPTGSATVSPAAINN